MHVKVRTYAALFVTEVFLDGVKQEDVVEFNTEEGWIQRYVKTDEGSFKLIEDSFVFEKLEGDVTYTMKDGFNADFHTDT